jgi:hypothetical protein
VTLPTGIFFIIIIIISADWQMLGEPNAGYGDKALDLFIKIKKSMKTGS